MSRTIRRRDARWLFNDQYRLGEYVVGSDGRVYWCCPRGGWFRANHYQHRRFESTELFIAWQATRFHSDVGSDQTPPADFRRVLERTFRYRSNNQLHQAVLTGVEHGLLLPKRIRTVRWLWDYDHFG